MFIFEKFHFKFISAVGDDGGELIRHFLIESSAKGVHLKGADEEPYFGKKICPVFVSIPHYKKL